MNRWGRILTIILNFLAGFAIGALPVFGLVYAKRHPPGAVTRSGSLRCRRRQGPSVHIRSQSARAGEG
jgi:hypothetical protein